MATRLLLGDSLERMRELPDASVQCCVTSPPYFGLRDYGNAGQIGLEGTPAEYVANLVAVFREVRRVLRDDGVVWLNLGDSYAGNGILGRNDAGRNFTGGGGNKLGSGNPGKQGKSNRVTCLHSKQLLGIPWRVAFALQADGWILRSDVIWHKPNAMPESVRDRPTKAHEYLFLLAKSQRYYYDSDAIAEPAAQPVGVPRLTGQHKADAGGFTTNGHGNSSLGSNQGATTRNKRSVWSIPTKPYPHAHFATFPEALVEPCLLAGSRPGNTVLDPFCGSGTVGAVAVRHGRDFIGIDLNAGYLALSERRIAAAQPPLFAEVAD